MLYSIHIFMQMITLNLYLYAHIYPQLPYIYLDHIYVPMYHLQYYLFI